MIIVVRCWTCGKVLGNKIRAYERLCKNAQQHSEGSGSEQHAYLEPGQSRDQAMEELGITRLCCRRHMLGHIDMVDDL